MAANLAFDQFCSQVFDKFVRVCDMLSTFFVENLVANLLHQSRRAVVTRFQASLQLAFDLLSTCFRHAFDLLGTCFRHAHASRKPGLQPGLQLPRIMECGL